MTDGLDIIGDVHGRAEQLRVLLDRLGYEIYPADDAYRHPERRAVFVGDLVDRGPGQREVLQLVKAMVDSGSADIVMGNHEFNAIAYATSDPKQPNKFLRDHTEKTRSQHAAFLQQLDDSEREYYVDWFKTLPLWFDNGRVRVVHACWHEPSIRVVREWCGGDRLTAEHLADAATKGNDLYGAVEILLKGPEIDLTEYGQDPYLDWDNTPRTEARIRWWDPTATTLRDLADVRGVRDETGAPYRELPATEIGLDDGAAVVYTFHIPLFYGHYWRSWETHREDWTDYTACVDFSGTGDGPLVAYRWNGEPTISWKNYFPHDPSVVAQTPSA
jgi:hypothetical protein